MINSLLFLETFSIPGENRKILELAIELAFEYEPEPEPEPEPEVAAAIHRHQKRCAMAKSGTTARLNQCTRSSIRKGTSARESGSFRRNQHQIRDHIWKRSVQMSWPIYIAGKRSAWKNTDYAQMMVESF